VINMLIDERALVPAGADRGPTHGWADPVEHARMFHDDRRTGDYLRALAEAVRPGDVVLDIGTGSGVVAIAAARAGARPGLGHGGYMQSRRATLRRSLTVCSRSTACRTRSR
jgi:hypothetical protein